MIYLETLFARSYTIYIKKRVYEVYLFLLVDSISIKRLIVEAEQKDSTFQRISIGTVKNENKNYLLAIFSFQL